MLHVAFITVFLLLQDRIPFKLKEDFEIKFDLSFKVPERTDVNNTVDLDETFRENQKRTGSASLPYLKLLIRIFKVQSGEVKLKVVQDDLSIILSKKISHITEFKLEPGFTDDIKDRISGYKHVIQFYSSDKKVMSQIVIEFDTDGNYFVNGEKRGKI